MSHQRLSIVSLPRDGLDTVDLIELDFLLSSDLFESLFKSSNVWGDHDGIINFRDFLHDKILKFIEPDHHFGFQIRIALIIILDNLIESDFQCLEFQIIGWITGASGEIVITIVATRGERSDTTRVTFFT